MPAPLFYDSSVAPEQTLVSIVLHTLAEQPTAAPSNDNHVAPSRSRLLDTQNDGCRSKSKAKRPQKATKPVKSPKTLVHDLSGAIREPLRAPVHMRSA